MTVNAYVGEDEGRYHCDDDILEAAPENPVRFLSRSDWVWEVMIDGIEDLDRLEAYRQAEKRHINRSSDKTRVHKYLDRRERELAGEPITPEPETPAMAIATDGGTAAAEPETNDEPTPEPDDLHPDVRGLEVGEVLVVDRDGSTEYIFPTTPDVDDPYLCRVLDDCGDERTDEPIPLSTDEIQSRLGLETEAVAVDDVDVRPPSAAATSNDEREIVTDGGKDILPDRTAQSVYSGLALMIRNAGSPQVQPFPVVSPIGRTDSSGQICTTRILPQFSHLAAARSFSAFFVIQSLLDRPLSYLDLLPKQQFSGGSAGLWGAQ